MKKFRGSRETTMDLPDAVVREILLRLPVKSLLRFRSVCKSWLSLISDPLFAKSHFELGSNAPDRLLCLTASQTLSIDVDASFHDDSAAATLNFPITAPLHAIEIAGSCRGFVFLEDWDNRNLFVWNPSTGCCKKLPFYPTLPKFYPFKIGFGYDSSSDDYLVAVASKDGSADDSGTRIDFLSLKNNSWRKVDGTHPCMSMMSYTNYQDRGVFLNGAIHWLADLVHGGGDIILAFDLIQKNVRELPLPDDYEVRLEMYACIVLGGCISLFTVGKCRTNIWMMKEYGLKSSWSKSIMVYFEGTPINFFLPICFTKGGEIVGINDGELMKRKHEGELLEHRTYDIDECNAVMYTECLFALPGNIEEGGDRQR